MGRYLICAAAFTALSGVAAANAADAPVWLTDYTKAKAIGKRLKRPLFVVFR